VKKPLKRTEPLRAEAVAKDYGGSVGLAPLDLSIERGETVVLIGHNGAGKTTLTNLAAGLLEPSEGKILIERHEAGTAPARAALSYLADTPSLYDDLSVREHAQYIAALHEAEDWEERMEGLLEHLQLAHRADDLPSRFSRGLRQKTAILLAFVRPFSVLVVDEPFVGLDAIGKRALIDLIGGAAEQGAAVLVSTHQLDFIERADRCLALRDGEVIFDGPASDADVDALVPQ
jgi:ABC-type multidrug transport system ATPase subunit